MNNLAKYLGVRSFCSKVIVLTRTDTQNSRTTAQHGHKVIGKKQ